MDVWIPLVVKVDCGGYGGSVQHLTVAEEVIKDFAVFAPVYVYRQGGVETSGWLSVFSLPRLDRVPEGRRVDAPSIG